ncbi:LysR family transcriptional regulator [Ralstonia sp. SET104]|uniref:LysR family transcriptional regulator n=1 Tax=Ralstonia sp. SET104 TaxID=2448774 RepID=UPI000FFAEAAA|nr:LysR family transcriptional regulator [Ralstonia sp. SET104]GCB06605.1 LysR family transcriptional regulator [Ralstonia sp. SET104]
MHGKIRALPNQKTGLAETQKDEKLKGADWKDWEIFCRVVEGQGFTKGAALAGVQKSSASLAVSRVEASVHARLFERNTRHVRITQQGRLLYEKLAPLFEALSDVTRDAKVASEEVRGTLAIATPAEIGVQQLSPCLSQLMQSHPDLQVRVDVTWELPDLVRQGYDLAFVMTNTSLRDSGFVCKRVVLLERAFFASPTLVQRLGCPTRPADLTDWPTIANDEETSWEFFHERNEPEILPVQPRMRTRSAELRMRAALHGLGVTRLSQQFAADEVARGRLIHVLPAYRSSPLKIYALMPARRNMPAAVRVLLATLESTLGAAAAHRSPT